MTILEKKLLKELKKKKSWAEVKKLEQLKKSSKKTNPTFVIFAKTNGISFEIVQKWRSSGN